MQNLQNVEPRAGRQQRIGIRSKHTVHIEDSHKKVSRGGSLKKKRPTSFERRAVENSKHVLVVDDDYDSAFAVKSCLESQISRDEVGPRWKTESKSELDMTFKVTMYIDPMLALEEFKPRSYDLLLIDIEMPSVAGYIIAEKILKIDPNIKICFMSAGEINCEAIKESLDSPEAIDCFIKKTISCTDLITRVLQEL